MAQGVVVGGAISFDARVRSWLRFFEDCNRKAQTATNIETAVFEYWPDGARVAQHQPDGTIVYYLGSIEATRDDTDDWADVTRMYTNGVTVASRTTTPHPNTLLPTQMRRDPKLL